MHLEDFEENPFVNNSLLVAQRESPFHGLTQLTTTSFPPYFSGVPPSDRRLLAQMLGTPMIAWEIDGWESKCDLQSGDVG